MHTFKPRPLCACLCVYMMPVESTGEAAAAFISPGRHANEARVSPTLWLQLSQSGVTLFMYEFGQTEDFLLSVFIPF